MNLINRIFATGLLTVLFALGCTTDDAGDPGAAVETEEATADPALAAELANDPDAVPGPHGIIAPAAGCSFVQWCNAPGSEGARCVQQGCSFEAAKTECRNEVRQFCGSPVLCPAVIVDLGGTHWLNVIGCDVWP